MKVSRLALSQLAHRRIRVGARRFLRRNSNERTFFFFVHCPQTPTLPAAAPAPHYAAAAYASGYGTPDAAYRQASVGAAPQTLTPNSSLDASGADGGGQQLSDGDAAAAQVVTQTLTYCTEAQSWPYAASPPPVYWLKAVFTVASPVCK